MAARSPIYPHVPCRSKAKNDFGRIIRDEEGSFLKIVDHREANEKEKEVDEFNSGVYCFDKSLFFKALSSIDDNNIHLLTYCM